MQKRIEGGFLVKQRIKWIDGVKGLCGLWVLIAHFLLSFFPEGFVGWNSIPAESEKFDYYFDHLPYSLIINNNLVLYVFFALIAFIPAYQYFKGHDKSRVQYQAKVRYFRLMPSVLILLLVSFLFYKFELYTMDVAAKELGNPWLAALVPDMSLGSVIYAGLVGSYLWGSQYVPVFWCMHYIFLGSYLSYAIILMFGDMKKRTWTYIMLTAFGFFVPWTVSFIAGVAAADIIAHRSDEGRRDRLWGGVMLLAGLLLGCIPTVILPEAIGEGAIYGICSFLIIIGIGKCRGVSAFLEKKPLTVLGKYSFSLILVHPFVLCTLSLAMFLALREAGVGYVVSALLCFAASVPIIAALTVAFDTGIGKLTSKLCSIVKR